jgi:galactose mutarotase-like enzyme
MKKNEIEQYIGNQAQIGGSRPYTLTDGWGRNLRCIDVNSGSGLQYTILPDRGMDLSLASYKGINLVYLTCNGETHPAFYEPENLGWLRTFAGGLLTTCGLTYFGPPVTDDGEELGLHGRYSTVPAKQVADLSAWVGEEYHIKHKGIIEEGYQFGKKLRVEREITTTLGKNTLRITDKVTNFGYQTSPYTILYHMNFGYPLLNENAELTVDSSQMVPRDETARAGVNTYNSFEKPQPDYQEQVFFHKMKGNTKGETTTSLKNKKLGICLTLKFNMGRLPYLTQWKLMGQGEYVLGLEPCNAPCKSRKALWEENLLPYLKAGESVTNVIEVMVEDM